MYSVNNGTPVTYYFIRDALGDISSVCNAAGRIRAEYAYDAYGNCAISGDFSNGFAEENPFRYRGYFYDTETGFYYCQTRYYNPAWGRFISMDSPDYLSPDSVAGMNLYVYCNNDPVNFSDPTGHIATAILIGLIVGAIIGAGVGFGTAAYIDYQNDGQLFNGDVTWYNYLGATLAGGIIGGVLGAGAGHISTLSWTFTLPLLGIPGGEVLAMPLSIVITGTEILTGIAGLGVGILMFSQKADRYKKPGNNQAQNRFIDHLQQKYGFSDNIRRRLHDKITGRRFTKEIIENILRELLGL